MFIGIPTYYYSLLYQASEAETNEAEDYVVETEEGKLPTPSYIIVYTKDIIYLSLR